MRKRFFVWILLLFLFNYGNAQKNIPVKDSIFLFDEEHNSSTMRYTDTIRINYNYNKDLFDILPQIPDSAIASWIWTKKERQEITNSVKKNNFFSDTDFFYNNIQEIKPNYLSTQVVDGSWELALYKIKKEHYIVITNDITGDGKNVMTFEYSKGNLKSIANENIFDQYPEEILKTNSTDCKEQIEHIIPYMSYDFANKNEVTFYYDLDNKKCFKGNTVTYLFDKNIKKFLLSTIEWY
ncbi:hypothetical protein ETU08_06670 [Apibacter muscae]|uniref:hypothetical protein n=1 Tax=Apibacter muscae TaxID=2509004 RepID=UPI0011AD4C12|nr:hypothetical protein [Apibacter muscae]TWP29524.1 hypothetical protein ETU08_06670 [Apibacter muscae]